MEKIALKMPVFDVRSKQNPRKDVSMIIQSQDVALAASHLHHLCSQSI